MKIHSNLSKIVGKTPLVELNNFEKNEKIASRILAKLEYFNPFGSIKDRVALKMILDAEEKKILVDGATIIEPTSGNTGIALAALGLLKGYKVIIVMPENNSSEKEKILKSYGARVILTDPKRGMRESIRVAKELANEIEHSVILGQFTNPNNPKIHYETTGKEIWDDTNGNIDILVSGVGTGGTISGVGKYLKEKNPDIKIVAVEPESSPVLSKGESGSHQIFGLGAGFIPYTLDLEVIDEVISVSEKDAHDTLLSVARMDGILGGVSSGAALYAAKLLSQRLENDKKTIVVILPDRGDKYLSILSKGGKLDGK